MKFSVIVPVYNEEENVPGCIWQVRGLEPEAEIIIVDGGSTDGTVSAALQAGACVLRSELGRGTQFRVGARQADGDLLLFLHADTQLPADAFRVARQVFQDERVQVATYRLRFDARSRILAVYTFFSRFDSIFTRFGDQGILIRKEFYMALGGFPEWPLFEDVRLLQLARRRTRVFSLPATVTTSARRYLEHGVVRQQLRNLGCMLQYLAGVSPERLAERYRGKEKRQPG